MSPSEFTFQSKEQKSGRNFRLILLYRELRSEKFKTLLSNLGVYKAITISSLI